MRWLVLHHTAAAGRTRRGTPRSCRGLALPARVGLDGFLAVARNASTYHAEIICRRPFLVKGCRGCLVLQVVTDESASALAKPGSRRAPVATLTGRSSGLTRSTPLDSLCRTSLAAKPLHPDRDRRSGRCGREGLYLAAKPTSPSTRSVASRAAPRASQADRRADHAQADRLPGTHARAGVVSDVALNPP